jgi:hypothetical protein
MTIIRVPIRFWMARALRGRRRLEGYPERGDACWGTYTTLGRLYNRALIKKDHKPNVD